MPKEKTTRKAAAKSADKSAGGKKKKGMSPRLTRLRLALLH